MFVTKSHTTDWISTSGLRQTPVLAPERKPKERQSGGQDQRNVD